MQTRKGIFRDRKKIEKPCDFLGLSLGEKSDLQRFTSVGEETVKRERRQYTEQFAFPTAKVQRSFKTWDRHLVDT